MFTRLFLTIALVSLSRLLFAQCNPPVTIAPIPFLCAGDMTYQLIATPAGGVWSGNQISPGGLANISNLSGAQFATYIYSDATCADTVTAYFQVNNGPGVSAGTDFTIVCGNINYLVGAYITGPNNTAFWSTSDGHFVGPATDPVTPIDKPGTYVLTAVSNSTGCARRDTVVCYPYLPSFPHTQITDTICQGDALLGYAVSGHFYDKFETGAACDSFRVLHLTVLQPLRDTVVVTTCSGTSVEGYNTSGIYRDTFAAVSGCDSLRVLDLTVLPVFASSISSTTCHPAQAGIFSSIFTGTNGCDSVVTNTVVLLPSSDTLIAAVICAGSSYENYDSSGIYTDLFTNQYGCDSIRVIDLTVLLQLALTSEIQADHGMGEGAISITPQGGTPPFLFAWSNGDSTAAISGLSEGAYTLTLTDGTGCAVVFSFFVPLSVGTKTPGETPAVILTASPNPVGTGETTHFTLVAPDAGEYFISVFNAAGSLGRQFVHAHSGTTSEFTLQFIGSGIQVVCVTDARGRSTWVRVAVVQ